MNYLLDTHIFLWSLFEPERLPVSALSLIRSPHHQVYVSAVTFWEISLKHRLGKLSLGMVEPEQLPAAAERTGFLLFDLTAEDAAAFHRLPRHAHRDPFDRMLVWQAIRHQMTLISRDREVHAYARWGLRYLS